MILTTGKGSRAKNRAAWGDSLLLTIFLFVFGGTAYYLTEIMFRGWSHPSMGILGGFCFYLLYLENRAFSHRSLLLRSVLGALVITALELLSGCVLNILLGMNIWDYSNMPLNFLGQICFSMSVLWFLLSIVGCGICTFARKYIFEYQLLVDTADGAVSADAVHHTNENVSSQQ